MNHVLSVFSPRGTGVAPQPIQEVNGDRYSGYLALILDVVPDVQLEHAMEQIKALYPTYDDRVTERIVRNLLDNPSYPKIKNDDKGKRKTNEIFGGLSLMARIDYASVDRPKPAGKNYKILALVSPPCKPTPIYGRHVDNRVVAPRTSFTPISPPSQDRALDIFSL